MSVAEPGQFGALRSWIPSLGRDCDEAYRVAQMMKNLLTLWETWVQFLGQEDRLEKGMTTHSSILAWRIPWTEEIGRLQSMELQRVGHN